MSNCCFLQHALHGVHSPCSHRSVVQWCGHMQCPCVYWFVSSRSGSVFNPSAGAITDHSQSAKDIDQYFKSQLHVEDPGHRKPVLSLPNGLRNPESECTTEILLYAVGGIRTHNLLIDSPAFYHWAITAHLVVLKIALPVHKNWHASDLHELVIPDWYKWPLIYWWCSIGVLYLIHVCHAIQLPPGVWSCVWPEHDSSLLCYVI